MKKKGRESTIGARARARYIEKRRQLLEWAVGGPLIIADDPPLRRCVRAAVLHKYGDVALRYSRYINCRRIFESHPD